MIRLGIIGAGAIFQHQISALSEMQDKFCLRAVCDLDVVRLAQARATVESAGLSGDISFCSSPTELEKCDCDAVLIATPPATHYELSIEQLKKGKAVLLEKPAVLSIGDLLSLYSCEKLGNAFLHVAYHAAFAADLLWWINNQAQIKEAYSLGELSEIYCGFYDPYVIDGQTLAEKESLLGSYFDSGVNQLSVCERIVCLEGRFLDNFCVTAHKSERDEGGNVIASETECTDGEISIHMDTGWIYGLNRKRTVLCFRSCGKQIVLDHSNQQVVMQTVMTGEDIISDMRGKEDIELSCGDECLFADRTEPRLKRHYMGVFGDFERALSEQKSNYAQTMRIHSLLLENA